MRKALFIDRDGTLILEPTVTFQVDTLEQLEFTPKVFRVLHQIRKNLDFNIVIVSNQDGLGTDLYPQATFDLIQGKIVKAFINEGVHFDDILIDNSTPEQNKPTRKPGIAMLKNYTDGSWDMSQSFVIGDRVTDIEFAKNLGCQCIWFAKPEQQKIIHDKELMNHCVLITDDWDKIYAYIAMPLQMAEVKRTTKETDVYVRVSLNNGNRCEINTGLLFFDHMLEQIARHAGIELIIEVKGDLEVDEHHTIEDTAIALGEAINKAIGSKAGMDRYGFVLPMDDSLAQVAIDFGGRPWLVWDVKFKRERIGDVPTEMFFHFFKSFSDAARCNLNIQCKGENEHHMAEAIFKGLAKSLSMALRRDPLNMQLPSTKGLI